MQKSPFTCSVIFEIANKNEFFVLMDQIIDEIAWDFTKKLRDVIQTNN